MCGIIGKVIIKWIFVIHDPGRAVKGHIWGQNCQKMFSFVINQHFSQKNTKLPKITFRHHNMYGIIGKVKKI